MKSNKEKDLQSYWHFAGLGVSIFVSLWYLFGNGFEYMLGYFGDSHWLVVVLKYTIAMMVIYSPLLIPAGRQEMKLVGVELTARTFPWLIFMLGVLLLLATVVYGLVLPLFVLITQSLGDYWWLAPWALFLLKGKVVLPWLLNRQLKKNNRFVEPAFNDVLSLLKDKSGVRIINIDSIGNFDFFMGISIEKRALFINQKALRLLTDEEFKSVMLHEIGHLVRKKSTLWIKEFKLISELLAYWLVAVLLPLIFNWTGWENFNQIVAWLILIICLAQVLSFGLKLPLIFWSRYEEYLADEFAARKMGESQSMISALQKMSQQQRSYLQNNKLSLSPLAEHPSLENRIKRLQRIFN